MDKTKRKNPGVVFAATDLSAPADEALKQAHERAKSEEATLVVCHIVPNLTRVNMLFPHRTLEQTNAQVELHRQALQAVIDRTCKVTGRVASEFKPVGDDGTPYAGIVEHAERMSADLIVVGDRGATGLRRMLLGSVADKVIRYAHAPVLVARAGARSGKVLVATDLSDPSLPAVAAAAHELRRTGAGVTALHCIDPVPIIAGPEYGVAWSPGVTPSFIKETRERAREKLAEAFQRFELAGDQRVVEGAPAATILSTAEELGVDLIILGTRGKTGLRRVLLGSVAEAVVRHAPCSVLVVRLADDDAEAAGVGG